MKVSLSIDFDIQQFLKKCFTDTHYCKKALHYMKFDPYFNQLRAPKVDHEQEPISLKLLRRRNI